MMSLIGPGSRRVCRALTRREARRKVQFARSRVNRRDRIGCRGANPVSNRPRRRKDRAVGSREISWRPGAAPSVADGLRTRVPPLSLGESPGPSRGSARFYSSALGRCEAPGLSHSHGVLGHAATQAERRAL